MRKFTKLTISICVAYLLIVFFSLPTNTPVFAARKGSEWYYDNFTYEDRLNVRLAMDYAIPRQQIIDSVLQGLGTTLATPIEANAIGYDPTVTARDFNVEKALDHMERAFNYRYNDSAKDIEDRRGYFPMVIMTPPSRADRMEWAALTTRRFQEIGIDVTLKYANWNVAVGVFSPAPENQGFDYKHGGYDAFFIGWSYWPGSPNSDVSQWFGKANWPPYGTNIGYIDNAEVDEIINRSLSHQDKEERMNALKEFQVWFHDNLPYFIVLQLADLWALDPDLEGVSFGFDYPNFGNWSHPTADTITVQTPDDLKNLNPLMVSSYYDRLAGIWNGGFYGSLLTSYPDSPETYYGDLAESWTVSADGLVWTFNLREDIKFSDGSDFDAEDVAFTYDEYLHPSVVNHDPPGFTYLNASHINVIDNYTIEFTLNKLPPYGESLFTLSILSQEEMSQVPHPQWKTHVTTTTYAPAGTGPYMMDVENSNASESFVKMILNPYYDDTKRNAEGWFRNPNRIPVINCKLISTAASAVAALESGEINIIDSKVALHPYIQEINSSTWGKLETSLGWGHQGFYINQMNPIWGMNPANPRLLYPGDYDEVPFDPAALFFGILCLATVQIIRKRKSNKRDEYQTRIF